MNDNDDHPLEREPMTVLIERSSFGSPEAVASRRRTPAWVVEEIRAGLVDDD